MQNSCILFNFCVAVKEDAFEMVVTVYVQCVREISKNTTSHFLKHLWWIRCFQKDKTSLNWSAPFVTEQIWMAMDLYQSNLEDFNYLLQFSTKCTFLAQTCCIESYFSGHSKYVCYIVHWPEFCLADTNKKSLKLVIVNTSDISTLLMVIYSKI